MPDLAMLDYFYGDEAEQFTFYRIPKVLFTDPSYRRISSDAKILYGLMLDRMGLSVRNGWLDEYNRVFIFFTLEDALEYLCCGHTKAVSLFGELDKAGLIERKKQGQGKPTKIYVKNFVRNAEVLPFATFMNREWGNIGTNYVRGLAALGLQGFLIMICVGIYAVLVNALSLGGDLQASIWSCAAYTVLLCFSLFKTGSVAKSILNAH